MDVVGTIDAVLEAKLHIETSEASLGKFEPIYKVVKVNSTESAAHGSCSSDLLDDVYVRKVYTSVGAFSQYSVSRSSL